MLPTPVTHLKQAPVRIVTRQFLARATTTYTPVRRADDAARWRRGELQVRPTIKLAAEVFRVSLARVRQAQARLEPRGKRPSATAHLSASLPRQASIASGGQSTG
jgi:hypothetical protein